MDISCFTAKKSTMAGRHYDFFFFFFNLLYFFFSYYLSSTGSGRWAGYYDIVRFYRYLYNLHILIFYAKIYLRKNLWKNILKETNSSTTNLETGNKKQFIAGGDGGGSVEGGGCRTQTPRVRRSNAFRSWHSTCQLLCMRSLLFPHTYPVRNVQVQAFGPVTAGWWVNEAWILISCLLPFPWAALMSPCAVATTAEQHLLNCNSNLMSALREKKNKKLVAQHSVHKKVFKKNCVLSLACGEIIV